MPELKHPRAYEETWFLTLCRHHAPHPKPRDHNTEHTLRMLRLVSLADRRDGGSTTQELAKELGLSPRYTQTLIRWGRHYRNNPMLNFWIGRLP